MLRQLLACSPLTCLLVLLWMHQANGQEASPFVGRIVDASTNQPVAASIVVTDHHGEVVEIVGGHAHVEYLQRKWSYVDGRFEVPRTHGRITVAIRRGLETLPLEQVIDPTTPEQTFKLHRWANLADKGYMSGDTHVHFLEMQHCHLQMQGEDLEVLNLLTSDFTNDVEKFTGQLDPDSAPGRWVYVSQEFRDWQQGHINLLRLRKIIEPLGPFGGSFRGTSHRHLLLAPAARAAKEQGAAVTWAHFGDIPGTESPIDISLGLIDAVDLITQSDPMGLPLHWEPWRMEQPPHLPRLPALPGVELYYRFLNAGFRLPLAAGTDKMSDRIPVGSSRLYVRTGETRSFDAWIDGLKAGNGFVTNGPLMTFEVDGRESGEVVHFDDSRSVIARATARSLHPFSKLQIMANGQAVASSGAPRQSNQGIYEAELELPIQLSQSSWVAARVAESDGAGSGPMPRGMNVFAHANPIYFLRDGAKVRVQEAIDHLILYLRYTEHWFQTKAEFESPQKKREAVELAQRALQIYRDL